MNPHHTSLLCTVPDMPDCEPRERLRERAAEGERADARTSVAASVDAAQGNIAGPSGTTRADVKGAGLSGSGTGSSSTDIGTSVSDYGIQEAVRDLAPSSFVRSHHRHILQLRLSPV